MQASPHTAHGLAPVPTSRVDYYLLALRWLIFGGVSVITLSFGRSAYEGGVGAGTVVSPWVAVIILAAYNLPVSAFIWRLRPLASGRLGGLLLADVVLATIITALTGGGGSLFSLLFMIPILEAGLAYRWRIAIPLVATISLLSLLASLRRNLRIGIGEDMGQGSDQAAPPNKRPDTYPAPAYLPHCRQISIGKAYYRRDATARHA